MSSSEFQTTSQTFSNDELRMIQSFENDNEIQDRSRLKAAFFVTLFSVALNTDFTKSFIKKTIPGLEKADKYYYLFSAFTTFIISYLIIKSKA
jgi:hypothetical protein